MSESGFGLELLQQRVAALPDLLCEALREPEPQLGIAAARMRRWLVTGIGSSAGHARFLASVLSEELGLPARFVPTAALAGDPGGSDATLIVFSQGLSPNASFALAGVRRWGRVLLLTGVREGHAPPDRVARLGAARAAGVRVIPLPPALGEESRTLLRVAGPVVAYVAAVALARALARDLGRPVADLAADEAAIRAAAESAPERAARLFARDEPLPFTPGVSLGLLASGGYAERAGNLVTKFQEGLLRPAPGCWDALEFVHGPFQQLYAHAAELLFLARPDAPEQGEQLELLAALLPQRHSLHVLRAELSGPFAILDHELLCNALVLRAMAEQGVEPGDWPGRGIDAPLYDLEPPSARVVSAVRATSPGGLALERATSPEVAEALAAGRTTAVLALGSTEQHGPHLPLATDTTIGDALAARFCARVPEAQRCPTLPLGCASEHLGFAGTLSLAPGTLEAILGDVSRSLNQHGFLDLFVFTAHGGNAAALRDMAARLDAQAGSLNVIVFSDQRAVGAACAAVAARYGISPEAAGQHAGEFETSIIAALLAGAVRSPLPAGMLDGPQDAERLFYPDLRVNAPNGVVGDPRDADSSRAEAYLEAWVDLLESGYRAAKKRHQTKGTQSE